MKILRCLVAVPAVGLLVASGQAPPQEAPNLLTLPTGEKLLSWHGHAGRSYFLQVSDPTSHLEKWFWAPVIEGGADAEISYEVDGTADKGFFRIHHTDQVPGAGETLDTADFDLDGLSNLGEISPPAGYQTNPLNPDTDGDGLPDGWEGWNYLDPNDDGSIDPDNGGSGDPDGDGLANLGEFQAGADPYNTDSDYDGIPDGWEVANGLDPLDGYANGDPDNDGINNFSEYVLGFNPQDASSDGTPDIARDRDGDGMPDRWEASHGKIVWDNDQWAYVISKTLDWEVADGGGDLDLDILTNLQEYQNNTDPNDLDSDDDFMPDGWEVQYNGMTVVAAPVHAPAPSNTAALDPNDPGDATLDPDGDGLANVDEYRNGSLPHLGDSDGDDATDGDEVAVGADPGDASDGGVPGGSDSGTVVVEIPFAAGGDYAWWEMKIEGQGPDDERVQRIHSNKDAEDGYGDYEGEPRMIKLHAGNSYKVTIKRMGGVDDENDGTEWYCWSANVGTEPDTDDLLPGERTFPNYPQSASDRIAETSEAWTVGGEDEDGTEATWLIDNSQGLFTQHVDDYGNDVAQSLEAFLLPLDIDEVISDQIAGNEANKLPTLFYGNHPNNPMLMATRTGTDARLVFKMNVPPSHAASIRVGIREKGQTAILNSAASAAPPAETNLSFSVPNGTKTYEVVAGYDANGNMTLDPSEATIIFQKTPKIDPDGTPYSGGDTTYAFLDKILIVTEDDYVSARTWTQSYDTTLEFTHPTGSDLMGMFATGASGVPGVGSTAWGQTLDANVIPSPQGLSHPLGAKWNAANQANTFKIVFPITSPIAVDLHQSTGIVLLRDRLIMAIKDNLLATATGSKQTSAPIPFSDDKINFEGTDPFFDLHLALGKCKAEGTITVEYSESIDGSKLHIHKYKLDGYVNDLYDWAYGTNLVLPGAGQIDLTKDAARTQAGHATLTSPAATDAGRVFFTSVEINTGWTILGIPY